jgi:hypothetical protein
MHAWPEVILLLFAAEIRTRSLSNPRTFIIPYNRRDYAIH